jgi:cysteine synthase B
VAIPGALAMIAQLFHIEIELVLPEDSTKERTQTMRAYGATVILTPAATGIIGSRDYADKSRRRLRYLNQFANEDNWRITKQLDQKSGTIPKEL